jgi:peptide/nickel transport system substrate-binding protein
MSRTRAHTSLKALAVATVLAVLAPPLPAAAAQFVETPMLSAAVAAGTLPPIAERLPNSPRVVTMSKGKTIGKHGGELRTLVGRARDVRLLVVFGYARLVTYNEDFELEADILESFDVEEGRIFTFHLRPNHRWSDGHPFTADDFRYYWEDVLGNEELSPGGPPRVVLMDGETPVFEVIDETTVRYSWSKPNPYFLPALAGATPLFLYRPAHYLKQFHMRYGGEQKIAEMVEAEGQRDWVALHFRKDQLYKFENVDMPTLQPWRNTTRPPATRFVAERNPYFHRVDQRGQQLPYIDRVILLQVNSKLIPAKAGSGEVDLQARHVFFSNYTFIKSNEGRNDFTTRLWREAKGSHFALFPNLNISDPEWRRVFRDVRFRRALSLAIDRTLINEVLYFGLALESNNTVLPQSPLFREEYQRAWAEFDMDRAARLLDEMGLKRGKDGIRQLPDGRPLNIIVETAGENTEETDVLELIHETWAELGVRLFTRPSQREVFRNRIFAGQTMMSVWTGFENGVPSADMSPAELAPTTQQSLQWPKWGQYYETSGAAGEPPDMEPAAELLRLNAAWRIATTRVKREEIWARMLEIHKDQMFTIGVVSSVRQPVIVHNQLRNVPEEAVYGWDPGAQFGVYRPDTFWFATAD